MAAVQNVGLGGYFCMLVCVVLVGLFFGGVCIFWWVVLW